MEIERCSNCQISNKYPGVLFDKKNICNFCQEFDTLDNDKNIVFTNHEKILQIIDERKGKSTYDVLVAYSGGKDSSFTLYYLTEVLKLKVLALLIDNDFISDRAQINARLLTSAL